MFYQLIDTACPGYIADPVMDRFKGFRCTVDDFLNGSGGY
jgi:hypothetical protein